MKEIRKVLEWIANKFRKTTETVPEPRPLRDLFTQIGTALRYNSNDTDSDECKTTNIIPEPSKDVNNADFRTESYTNSDTGITTFLIIRRVDNLDDFFYPAKNAIQPPIIGEIRFTPKATNAAPEPPQEANYLPPKIIVAPNPKGTELDRVEDVMEKPTTVIGWLDTLPDGYRELAIKNMIEHRGIYECDSAHMALFMSSTWRLTPERQEFWSMVYGWLNGQSSVSELPPLPQSPPNDSNDSEFRIVSKDELKPMRSLSSPVEPMSDKTMDAIFDMFKSMSNHATQLRTLTSMSMPSFSRDLLEQELLTCIATENYERCAEIKVQLDKLNKVND